MAPGSGGGAPGAARDRVDLGQVDVDSISSIDLMGDDWENLRRLAHSRFPQWKLKCAYGGKIFGKPCPQHASGRCTHVYNGQRVPRDGHDDPPELDSAARLQLFREAGITQVLRPL